MNIRLVIFDIAGTTVVDKQYINDAFKNALWNAGYQADAGDINMAMGYRKIDAIKIIVDKYNHEPNACRTCLVEKIHNDFRKDMAHFYEHENELKAVPFAEEVFEELQKQRIKIALNTGLTKAVTNTILSKLGWNNSSLINAVISSDEAPGEKPRSLMVTRIMQQLKINDVYKVAKVGGTGADIQEGRNAGCGLVVAVSANTHTKENLKRYYPDYIIDSLQQLPALTY